MSEIKIRRATAQDAEPLCAIFGRDAVLKETLLLPFSSVEKWRERLAGASADVMLVAEIEQQVVGNAGLHLEAGRRRLHAANISIAVHEDWHHQGVGTALMQALVDMADHYMQITRLELTVFAINKNAIALYQKFGFIEEGVMRNHAFRQGFCRTGFSWRGLNPDQHRRGDSRDSS